MNPASDGSDSLNPSRAGGGWLGPWFPVLVALLSYANSLGNGFTYDDNPIVRENPRIRSIADLRGIWLTDWWFDPIEGTPLLDPSRDRLYRPLTLHTFALNYAVHGLDPLGYHALNVALHAGVCALVWLLARRLMPDVRVAFVAALLFAVHPVHVEAVANVVGRAEVLAAALLLAGLLLLARRNGLPGPGRTVGAAVCFLAATFAKETAISYPLLAAAVLYWLYGAARGWRWWLTRVGLLVAPLAVYFPMRIYALEGRMIRDRITSILFNPLFDAEPLERFVGAFTVLGHYVRLLLVPSRLNCDYGYAVIDPEAGPTAMTLLGVAGAAGLIAGAFAWRSRHALLKQVGKLCTLFLASYALISNTVLLIGVSLAERLMYWPSVPAIVLIAVLVVAFGDYAARPGGALAKRTGLLRVCGVLLVVALGARTVVRNSDWRDDLPLFRADVATHPESAHLNASLGQLLLWEASQTDRVDARSALLDEAAGLYDRALALHPRFEAALKQRGTIFLMQGQPERAIPYLESAVQLNPMDEEAQQRLAQARGASPELRARVEEALATVGAQPEDVAARLAAGYALLDAGRNYEALQQFEAARDLAPDDAEVLKAYGEGLLVNYQQDAAREVLARVAEIRPGDWQVHLNLSKLFEHEPARSLHHARLANEANPDDLRTVVNLAEALALNGRTEDAVTQFRRALASLPAGHPLRRAVESRLRDLGERP